MSRSKRANGEGAQKPRGDSRPRLSRRARLAGDALLSKLNRATRCAPTSSFLNFANCEAPLRWTAGAAVPTWFMEDSHFCTTRAAVIT